MAASVGYRGIDQNYNYSSFERSQLLSNLGEASAFSISGTCHSIGMNLENNQKFQSSHNNERHEKSSKTHSRGKKLLRAAKLIRTPEAQPKPGNLLSNQQHLHGSIERDASLSSYSFGAASSRGDISRSADYVSIPVAPERNEQRGLLPQQHGPDNLFWTARSAPRSNSLAKPPPSLEEVLNVYRMRGKPLEDSDWKRLRELSDENRKKRCCRANPLGCYITGVLLAVFSTAVGVPVLVAEDSNTRTFGAVWVSVFGGLYVFSLVALCSDCCCKKVSNFVCNWLRRWVISDEEARVISHNKRPCISQGLCDCDVECNDAADAASQRQTTT